MSRMSRFTKLYPKLDAQHPIVSFTSTEVHDLLNAEVARRYPELKNRSSEMASVVSEMDEFIGVNIYVDADSDQSLRVPLGIVINPGLPTEAVL